jgi:hypothetical protein
MGRVRDFLRKETEDWFFGPVSVDGPGRGYSAEAAIAGPRMTVPPVGRAPVRLAVIQPDSAYLSVHLEAMRIRDVRVGAQTFYGSVTSVCTVQTRSGQPAELIAVTTPRALRAADPKHLDRVITGTVRLMDAVPYRGGGLDIEIGLFSVPGGYLVGPYLDFLGEVATAVGTAYLPAAAALTAPLRKGLDLLFGAAADARLEIGLAHTWTEPVPGYYAAVRAPAPRGGFTLGPDTRLHNPDGTAVTEPYLVLRLVSGQQRHNWAAIPDIQAAYQALSDMVRRSDLVGARDALAAFRRAAVFSPDLLAADAARLHDLVRNQVTLALPAVGTAGRVTRGLLGPGHDDTAYGDAGHDDLGLPGLADLPLY